MLEHSKKRRTRLEDARNLFHFLQDHEDEERWVVERQRICKAGITAKDLRAVFSLQQKHKALQDEMKVIFNSINITQLIMARVYLIFWNF